MYLKKFIENEEVKDFEERHKVQQKLESELSNLKKRIDMIALNYTTLTDRIKTIKEYPQNNYQEYKKKFEVECHKYGKAGHIAQHCTSERTRQLNTKEAFVKSKNINFCELVYNNEINNPEVYNVEYDSEGGDTFDEFDYEEDEGIDEVEGHFFEEYYEENLVLFLTNIEEVPVEKNKEETNIDEKI
ncbi:11725_t:CDS:2 [Gigaspora margarita]|uniref:11725_t:CDS:1 n=1 Tax=Gigaspora margarita TaxID=4874 RepID=A0ABN7VFA5_GIGMA|nr:11725_t:CDS:2 [Gigaspora margarita]